MCVCLCLSCTHLQLVRSDEAPVPRCTGEVPLSPHTAIILTQGLIIRHTHPPAQWETLDITTHKPEYTHTCRQDAIIYDWIVPGWVHMQGHGCACVCVRVCLCVCVCA